MDSIITAIRRNHMLRIHTFNTNGNSKEKLTYIPSGTLDSRYVNIILVQEAGTENTGLNPGDELKIQGKPFICMMRADDPQSSTEKCSTLILY